MALPINIDDLIHRRKVEGGRIEYKAGWNPEKVVHTICAFANDIDNWGGGYIILGIEEQDGRPIFPVKGINPAEVDAIQKELLNVCHLIEPVYLPVVEVCECEGKTLIVIWVTGGCERPYKCPEHIVKDGKSPKAYYIRKLASTIKATGPDEKALFELTGDVPFDDRTNVHADITDLKMNLLVEFLHEVGSDLADAADGMSVDDLAQNLQIAVGPTECFKPKNVGLMFFNPHPENFFRYAWIEVVDKPDPTGEGMVEQTFRGPLHIQLRAALDYIRNRFLREKIFKHDDRPESDRIWNYPYRAIEEALANAVYHKSYRIPEPITVVVTPTEMTISSLPGPERSITDEDLKSFHMVGLQYRNRRIGEFLKELDLVEGRNTGVPVIVKEMRRNHSPDPIFRTPETRDWLSVVLPLNSSFCQNNAQESGDMSVGESSVKHSVISSVKPALKTASKPASMVSPIIAPITSPITSSIGVTVMSSEEELLKIASVIKSALGKKKMRKPESVIQRLAHIVQEMRRDEHVTIDQMARMMEITSRTIDTNVAILKRLKIISSKGATRNSQWKVLI